MVWSKMMWPFGEEDGFLYNLQFFFKFEHIFKQKIIFNNFHMKDDQKKERAR